MSDKELIKEEIERRISQFEAKYPKDLGGYWNDEESAAYDCAEEYKNFLLFIDSLPEEPASEDLDEAAKMFYDNCNIAKSSWWDEGVLHKMSESKETFIAGAEWQKQKDFQDFLEKAEMYLKTRVYYNMHPSNVTIAIQEFKNYMKDE